MSRTGVNHSYNEMPPSQELFGLRLGLVARLWRAEIYRLLATFGLTESRWLTLLHISRLPHAATQRELAEAVGVRGPTLVRTLDRLAAEGLIARRTEDSDRRTKSVTHRAAAAHFLERHEETAAAVRAETFTAIPQAEVRPCRTLCERIGRKRTPA